MGECDGRVGVRESRYECEGRVGVSVMGEWV